MIFNLITVIWLQIEQSSLTVNYLRWSCRSFLLMAVVTFDLYSWSQRHSERDDDNNNSSKKQKQQQQKHQQQKQQQQKQQQITFNCSRWHLPAQRNRQEVQLHNKNHCSPTGNRNMQNKLQSDNLKSWWCHLQSALTFTATTSTSNIMTVIWLL